MVAEAEQVGADTLAQAGPRWAGRTTVLRRLAEIQSTGGQWQRVGQTCRTLLEIDPNDVAARWMLLHAQYRDGDPQGAWQTFKRAGVALAVGTPMQAQLLLDLARRYTDAAEIAGTALAMLRAFPDDHDVHWAAIAAVTARSDRTELPEDLNAEMTAAWQAYFDRYPDSGRSVRYTMQDDDDPIPAEIEEQVRRQALTYRDVLTQIVDLNAPIGMLDAVVGKPYAAIFPYRPLGYHRMVFPNPQDVAIELDLARSVVSGACLIDASALYTLALLPDVADVLLATIARPSITVVALRDLAMADDMFGLPSDGTLTYDVDTERLLAFETDADAIDCQRRQSRTMLSVGQTLRRVVHPDLLHLQSVRPKRDGRGDTRTCPFRTPAQRCGAGQHLDIGPVAGTPPQRGDQQLIADTPEWSLTTT